MAGSAASKQDAFKRKTLEAMASGDPYREGSDAVGDVQSEAMRQQVSDNQAGGAPPRISSDIAGGVPGSAQGVKDYMDVMAPAQDAYDTAFSQAAMNYAPPPLYDTPSKEATLGGLDADELGAKIQVIPEWMGGGIRYGGFRTKGEYDAATEGLGFRIAAENEARDLGLNDDYMRAAVGAEMRRNAMTDRAEQGARLGGPARPVMSRGLRFAEEEGNAVRRAMPTGYSSTVDRGHSTGLIRASLGLPDEPAGAEAVRADIIGRTPRRPVVSRGLHMLEEPANVMPSTVAARGARAAADAYVPPEQYLNNQLAAESFGGNPFIAEGTWQEPTSGQRSRMIADDIELAERMADRLAGGEGYDVRGRNAIDDAYAVQEFGSDAVAAARRVGVDPAEYAALSQDPTFMDAAAFADEAYNNGYDLSEVEVGLGEEFNLTIPEVKMILDQFRGMGVSPEATAAYRGG